MMQKSKKNSLLQEGSKNHYTAKNGGDNLTGNGNEDSDDCMEFIPDATEVEKQFAEMLSEIELSKERIKELRETSLRHKWNMIKAQDAMHDGKKSVKFYLDHLERHLNPQLYAKNPTKKMLKGIVNVELLLTSLEVDLRSSPNPTWLREFIDEPNCGYIVLLKFLNHIQQCVSGTSTPNGTPKKKMEILSKDSYDEYLCLLCIKAITKNKYGFQTILGAPRSLSLMARSLRLNNRKTRTTVLKLLTQACEQPDGHEKVLKAVDDYKVYCSEKFRFESLVLSITTRPCNPVYQQTVLQFLNAIITYAPSSNLRVYYQQEIENAGFNADAVEETLDGLDSTSVKAELTKWREKYVDVATVLDEFVTLRGRTVLLRDEVNLLQSKVKELEKEKAKVTDEKKDLETRVEDFKLRALELQASIENLRKHRQEKNTRSDEVTHALEDAIGDILKTEPPPPPPPVPSTPPSSLPPVPPPPETSSKASSVRLRLDSSVKLPMLNWTPVAITNEKSVFKSNAELDGLQKMLDFQEFEKRFELRSPREGDTLQKKQENALKKMQSTLNLLSPNKSKNLIITKRRIGKSFSAVQDAINSCNIVSLPAEHAELLLKLLPTKEELSSLAKHAKEYEKFGEAEKFLFQMAKVERYEAKLNTMAYVGLFDELIRGVLPRIDAVLKASLAVVSSVKLKRVFEVILLFGNYMNGSRRGHAEGFKLDSLTKLQDTKSSDRSVTFLHYLAEIIDTKLPHLKDFCDDFDLESSTKVSLQMIASDVQSLRKGLDLTKAEKEKQPRNFIIYNFYNRALTKVQKVGEKYRKMDDAFKDACVVFGENPKTKEPSEFFQTFIDFMNQFKKAQQENGRKNRAKVASQNQESIVLKQKRVANEAASVAQNRKSLIEAQMITDQNGFSNGHALKQSNGHT